MFTGVAAASWLAVLQPILEAFFSAFGRSFTDWLDRKRAEQAQRELGRFETASTINRESTNAERRASDLAVNRPDIGNVIDGMQRGDPF
jgi:hypothetical protein